MSTAAYSADVTQDNFQSLVLDQSQRIPVLVDFWAAWCGPCQMLMPVLKTLAETYQGKFFLAKINSDEQQALAARFGVRSIPTVKLFRHGQVVDEFMGVQPERGIRAMLDRYIPRESDALVEAAVAKRGQGNPAEALALLRQALDLDAGNDRVRLELARELFEQAQFDDGESVLDGLSYEGRGSPDVAALLARLEFVRIAAGAPPVAELEQAVTANPADHEARYRLAARKVLLEDYPAALEQLLEIVRRDRRFRDDAGRKTMLSLFNLLGGQDDLVRHYRHQLSLALN